MSGSIRLIVLFWLAFLVLPAIAWAGEVTDSGTVAGAGANWVTKDSVFLSDDKRANHSNTLGTDSIYSNTIGISLPTGAVLDSIIILVEGYGSSATAARRGVVVSPTKSGAAASWSASQNLNQSTDGTLTFTGGLWGTTWSTAELEASGFGILLKNSSSSIGTIYIDQLRVRLVYHIRNRVFHVTFTG